MTMEIRKRNLEAQAYEFPTGKKAKKNEPANTWEIENIIDEVKHYNKKLARAIIFNENPEVAEIAINDHVKKLEQALLTIKIRNAHSLYKTTYSELHQIVSKIEANIMVLSDLVIQDSILRGKLKFADAKRMSKKDLGFYTHDFAKKYISANMKYTDVIANVKQEMEIENKHQKESENTFWSKGMTAYQTADDVIPIRKYKN